MDREAVTSALHELFEERASFKTETIILKVMRCEFRIDIIVAKRAARVCL